jgi:hypothetical protein
MFTTVAWYQSVDPAGAYVALNAAGGEQHVFASGVDITVPALSQLVLAAGGAETTVVPTMRLESPSLRDIARAYIIPLNGAAAAAVLPQDPPRFMDRRFNPFLLSPNEQLEAWLLSDPAAVQIQWAIALLADAPVQPVGGGAEIMSLRWHAATAVTAGSWSNLPIIFDDTLPVGHYQVVGFRAHSVNLIAARLVFKGYAWRPGCIGSASMTAVGDDVFRRGNMGVWGEFDSTTPPNVDFLAAAADAVQHGVLDLIKTA